MFTLLINIHLRISPRIFEQQKRQHQQILCGKAIKVAGNDVKNMAVNVAVTTKKWP
jgi:hypothetical protein